MSIAIEPLTIASRFLSEIDRADTAAGCLDALHRAAEELGWSRFGYGWAPALRFRPGEAYPVMTRGLPASWKRDWGKHGRHDPYMEHACSSPLPFAWSQVIEKAGSLSEKQRDCISYVNDAIGTSVALTIPVHVSGRRPAFLSLIGERCLSSLEGDVQDEQAIALMRLLAQSLDNHLFGKAGTLTCDDNRLSNRERECMVWTARGKTVDDIATILDISTDTVRVYMKRIIGKLQVSNKTHAVAKALALGLIEPGEVS
ncbi:LuxR family transcriptional regulator [Novosphingobium sediminis]|uniref:LuxR family transcriptional regulator n=1 Tax=Novosphingobium sediminis TaxID=707214 RepID=A0A512ARE6_9SPHN|nr:LuxR family transcriptional regulator [Novosphingobium sediminis]GEO02127.1 LuxR family transcriptional regulator [Novosphingobium sediminis]